MPVITKRQAEVYRIENAIRENLLKIDNTSNEIEKIVYKKISNDFTNLNNNLTPQLNTKKSKH